MKPTIIKHLLKFNVISYFLRRSRLPFYPGCERNHLGPTVVHENAVRQLDRTGRGLQVKHACHCVYTVKILTFRDYYNEMLFSNSFSFFCHEVMFGQIFFWLFVKTKQRDLLQLDT